MERINKLLNEYKQCFEIAEKIAKVKGEVSLKLSSMDERTFKEGVCKNRAHRPFCYFGNQEYFNELQNLEISRNKFDNEAQYQIYLAVTKQYLSQIEPVVGVEAWVDDENIKFGITCPFFNCDWCILRNGIKTINKYEDYDF